MIVEENCIDVQGARVHNLKNIDIKIKVGEEVSFQNLNIKVLKCYNSKFDDDPEVTAYMQVKDITMNNNDKVFNNLMLDRRRYPSYLG